MKIWSYIFFLILSSTFGYYSYSDSPDFGISRILSYSFGFFLDSFSILSNCVEFYWIIFGFSRMLKSDNLVSDSFGFSRFSLEFMRISSDFFRISVEFSPILSDFAGFYRILLDHFGFSRILPNSLRSFQILVGFFHIVFFCILSNPPRFSWIILDFLSKLYKKHPVYSDQLVTISSTDFQTTPVTSSRIAGCRLALPSAIPDPSCLFPLSEIN